MIKRILLGLLLVFNFQAIAYAQLDDGAVIRYDDLQHPVLGASDTRRPGAGSAAPDTATTE